jgi:hypothetical protein
VNPKAIGTITSLYAALLRSDKQGIYGFAAKGAIQSYISFEITLDKYLEGVTTYYGETLAEMQQASDVTEGSFYDYIPCVNLEAFAADETYYVAGTEDGTYVEVESGAEFNSETQYYTRENSNYYVVDGDDYVLAETYDSEAEYYVVGTAPSGLGESAGMNYFSYVMSKYDVDLTKTAEKDEVNHYIKVFGCYSTEEDTEEDRYDYTNVLDTVPVLIMDENGNILFNREVKYTSTINLLDGFTFANSAKTKAYAFVSGGEKVEYSIIVDDYVVNGMVTLTRQIFDAVNVEYINVSDPDMEIVSVGAFIGEDVTTTAVYENYVILGTWCTDKELTNSAEKYEAGVTKLYAKLAKAKYTDEQGIEYTFTINEEKNGGTYIVSGFDKSKGYTSIVIANEVDGYKVVAIGNEALKEKELKNVVVPENVVTIGSNAFGNNYGIETVIFYADTITFETDSVSNKTGPFYGCSTSDGSADSKLVVYYNNVTNTAVSNGHVSWTHFRTTTSWGIPTYYYIGQDSNCGATYGNGTWANVTYVVNGYDSDFGLTSGIIYNTVTAEDITNIINASTAEEGYINGYTVEFDKAVELNAKEYTVTITVTENATKYYLVDLGENTNISVTGDDVLQPYGNNKYYVANGTEVTLTTPQDYVFTSIAINGEEYSPVNDGTVVVFTMNGKAVVEATCEIPLVPEYTIISAIDCEYVYNGQTYASGEKITTVISCKQLGTISAEGYYFVGWAIANGTSLEFTTSDTISYETYYAIWAKERDEVIYGDVTIAGNDVSAINATVNASLANSIEGWYADADFTTKVTTLSTSTTVLYARMNYTMAVTLSGNSSTYFYENMDSGFKSNNYAQKANNYNKEFTVCEGSVISIVLSTDGKKLSITIGDDVTSIRGRKVGTLSSVSDERVFKSPTLTGTGWTSDNTVVVQSNLTVSYTY